MLLYWEYTQVALKDLIKKQRSTTNSVAQGLRSYVIIVTCSSWEIYTRCLRAQHDASSITFLRKKYAKVTVVTNNYSDCFYGKPHT